MDAACKGKARTLNSGCQLLTVCPSEEKGIPEYQSVPQAECYWQQLDVFTYIEDVQAPATRKTNSSDDRGFRLQEQQSPHSAAYLPTPQS
jgi:hypothetical protein